MIAAVITNLINVMVVPHPRDNHTGNAEGVESLGFTVHVVGSEGANA